MTRRDWTLACAHADVQTKASNGHQFVTILKTRCAWCGRSPKTTTRCGRWFQTFLTHLAAEVITAPDPGR